MEGNKGQRERDRLLRMYGEMGDGELLGLSATAGDLTEVAQDALAGEMKRRGLEAAEAPGAGAAPLQADDAEEDEGAGWRTLHVFQQTFEAQAAFRLMERDEIEFAVEDRTIDSKGEAVAGPAIRLALMVAAPDWNRAIVLLRREAGLFPEAVTDPQIERYGDQEAEGGIGEVDSVAVGEFEEAGDVAAATQALTEAGIWFQVVTHEGEDWERTSVEVKVQDADRALEVLARLLGQDFSTL